MNQTTIKVSVRWTHLLAKQEKFTNGELIKSCLNVASKYIHSEKN